MAKRVSTDEKLEKILNFFTSASDVFTIKDLEKKIPKHCGISAMIVKDLLTKLIGDNIINQEKSGSTNLYWKFKYSEIFKYKCEIEKLEASYEFCVLQNEKMACQLEKLEAARELNSERSMLLSQYAELMDRSKKFEEHKELVHKYSVKVFNQIKNDEIDVKNRTNKFTDDIYSLQSFVCNKFKIDRKQFNSNFGVDEEMDYV